MLASLDLADKSLDVGEGETFTTETLRELVESVKRCGSAKLADQ